MNTPVRGGKGTSVPLVDGWHLTHRKNICPVDVVKVI